MKNLPIIFIILLISSCSPAPQEPARVKSLSSTSTITTTGTTPETPKIEVMTGTTENSPPDYLDHTPTGSGFELVKVLDDNSAYTRYQISYLSD
jgi:hypothetical protein